MGFLAQKQDYKPLAQDDERHVSQDLKRYIKTKNRLIWALTVAVISNLLLISVIAIQTLKTTTISKVMFSIASNISIYSSNVIDLSYMSPSFNLVKTQMNGTLFPPFQQSGSRLPPGPEADEYWENFQRNRLVPLSREDVVKLGKDPKISVQFPEGWGVTPGSYLGALDIFHKMHCLAELRRAAFQGYSDNGRAEEAGKHHDALHWIHLRHCADMLAQDLQCNANLDIITYNWMDTQPEPFSDFSIYRTCTNWDQLVDWSDKNTIINKTGLPDIIRPAGFVPIPAEPAYYEMYGFEDSVLYPGGKGYQSRDRDNTR